MTFEYHIVILAVLLLMAIIALVNVAVIRSLNKSDQPRATPMVSVLVPARNEAEKIGLCLSTLAEQDYPNYEVIVLDDGSTDGTWGIAEQWSRTRPDFRAIAGRPLPAGWVGKAHACHQLAQHASGELLLFVDADTMHHRHSIGASVAAMEATGADLLTVIPDQQMESFWERTILPLLHFVTFSYLPLPLVRRNRNPKFAMANGQLMLFKRGVYEAIGGHVAVRTALVEDVWLSRLVKQHGYNLLIMDGGKLVSCRMYASFKQIWEGFSKNLFPGFRYSILATTTVMLFNILTSVLPFVLLAAPIFGARFPTQVMSLIEAQVGILLLIRLLLAAKFRLNILSIPLHPIAILVLVGIAANSCWWVLRGGGSRWKGRQYDFRKRAVAH
jgi:chlorobactene glucosyltransferase